MPGVTARKSASSSDPTRTTVSGMARRAGRRPGGAMPWGRARKGASSSDPTRTTVSGMSRWVRRRPPAPPAALKPLTLSRDGAALGGTGRARGTRALRAPAERREDRGYRPRQGNQSRGEHRPGAGIADVGAPQLPRRHLIDPQPAGRHPRERDRPVGGEDREGRQEDQPGTGGGRG